MERNLKNIMKVLTVIVILMTIVSFTTSVFALEPSQIVADKNVDAGTMVQKANKIAGFIRNIAVIASVLILMILGVKYMLGSVEEKAEYKKSFVPLVVGIIVVVSATQIATMIFKVSD